MESNSLEVSPEFINENKNLVKPVQKSSAPYSKQKRFLRRQEVYRLHFELGYPAVKIADMMKINRNTINSDIKYWYSKLSDNFGAGGFHALMEKYQIRLEMQRTRLLEELNKHNDDLEEKLSIEKLILEIDSRINTMIFKIYTMGVTATSMATNMANAVLKETNQKSAYYSLSELIPLSIEKREAVNKILSGKYALVKTKGDENHSEGTEKVKESEQYVV